MKSEEDKAQRPEGMIRNSGKERSRRSSDPEVRSRGGWTDVLRRVVKEQSRDNVSMIAAGVSFYLFFAVFPAIAAAISIYGLVADPQQLQSHIDAVAGVMPQQAYEILRDQLTSLVKHSGGALSLGVATGILLALWSANKGMKALITAFNIVFHEEETRGFFKLNAISLLLTFCAILLGLIAISLVVAVPALINLLNITGPIQMILAYLRWPLLGIFLMVVLAIAYRVCPDRKGLEWRWISWGSVTATLLWLAVSILFSYYVANFGNYSKIYGSMGAVIILLMWFYISSYIILLGGVLNAGLSNRK